MSTTELDTWRWGLRRSVVGVVAVAVMAGGLTVAGPAGEARADCGPALTGTLAVPLTGIGGRVDDPALAARAAEITMGGDLQMSIDELDATGSTKLTSDMGLSSSTIDFVPRSAAVGGRPALVVDATVADWASCDAKLGAFPTWAAYLVAGVAGLAMRDLTVMGFLAVPALEPFALPAGEVFGGFTAGYLNTGLRDNTWGAAAVGAGIFGALLGTIGGNTMRIYFSGTRDTISEAARALQGIQGNAWLNWIRPAVDRAEIALVDLEEGYETAFEDFEGAAPA